MATSYSALSVKDQVQLMYVAYFGRAGDPAGMNHWIDDINVNHFTIEQVGDTFALQSEAKGLYSYLAYPNLGDPTAFVAAIYNNLFERAPDTAGLNYWVDRLTGTNTNGTNPNGEHISAGTMIAAIINGAYASTGTNHANDVASMTNKITVADYFTQKLIDNNITWDPATMRDDAAACIANVTWDPATIATGENTANASVSAFVATSGQTFTLTTGVDNIVGTAGNDTINASTGLAADGTTLIPTTNALDKIDGGLGNDTLVIENTGGKNTLTGTITNVENLTFVGAGNVNNNANIDVSSFSGTVTLSQTDDTAVTLNNVTGQTLALNKVVNGTTLTAALGATQTSVTLSNTAAVGTVTFSVSGAKLDTVNLTTDKTAGALIVADAGNTTKTANITATGTAAVTVSSTALENVKISGAGAVTLTAGTAPSKTLDASGSTGGVTYAVDLVAQQFTGSSAKDTVQFGATTKAQTLGAGDDAVTMSVAALGTGGSIDGGDGTDTISLSAANIATATSNATLGAAFQASISNFEKLGVGATGATATVVDAQYIDGITYLVSAGSTTGTLTINNMAGNSTFESTALQGAAVALNLKDNTGTADVLNLKFSASDGFTNTGVITAAGVETLNITTADTDATAPTTVFTAPINAAAVKSVVVAGNVGIDLTGLNATTLTSFDATGVTATGAAGAVTLVTGNLAADATIKGGAGDDVLNASAAVTKTVNIDGGAGNDTISGSASKVNTLTGGDGNDTIVGGSAADTISGGAGNDTITSGAGLDIVDVGTGNDTYVVTANANGNIYASITGMGAGDKIDFLAGGGAATFIPAKITLAATAAFADFLQAAAAGSADRVVWFQFAGDTYLVQDVSAGATFINGADQVVKLVGLVDLSTATIDGAATNILTLA